MASAVITVEWGGNSVTVETSLQEIRAESYRLVTGGPIEALDEAVVRMGAAIKAAE